MSVVRTVRIKSSDPASQGPYVILDAGQFDPTVHELYEPEAEAGPDTAPPSSEPDTNSPRPRGRRKG